MTLSGGGGSAPVLTSVLVLSLGLGLVGAVAAPASAIRTTVSSGAGVTISDAVDSQSGFVTVVDDGPATPYPSTLANTNPGLVTDVDVYLNNVNHGRAADLDLLLVGPGGQQVTLMSDAGGDNAIVNAFVVLDDEAAAPLTSAPVHGWPLPADGPGRRPGRLPGVGSGGEREHLAVGVRRGPGCRDLEPVRRRRLDR